MNKWNKIHHLILFIVVHSPWDRRRVTWDERRHSQKSENNYLTDVCNWNSFSRNESLQLPKIRNAPYYTNAICISFWSSSRFHQLCLILFGIFFFLTSIFCTLGSKENLFQAQLESIQLWHIRARPKYLILLYVIFWHVYYYYSQHLILWSSYFSFFLYP